MIIGGVDEAGRGPVIGPMCMAIVGCQDKAFLNKIGVKDSKLLSPDKRKKLSRIIRKEFPHVIIKVSPKEIDNAMINESTSLNTLEAETTGKLISRLLNKTELHKVIVDLPARNKEEYIRLIQNKLSHSARDISIIAEYKADVNHAQVAAASIIAKVARDASIASFEKKLGFRIGSGYPGDPNTQQSLKDNFDELLEKNLIRTQWKTVKEFLEARNQSTLTRF